MSDYISVGKFVASFGTNGQLVLKHVLGKKTDLKGLAVIFTEEAKSQYLPWFVQEAKAKNDAENFVELEGVSTKEAAQKLVQKQVWLKEEDFAKFIDKNAPVSLFGYTILEDGKTIGEIIEVIEQPHQILCTVLVGTKEAYIPLHQDSLLNIDRKKKQVHVTLPDGLLELYL